jgi:hypothetical protein
MRFWTGWSAVANRIDLKGLTLREMKNVKLVLEGLQVLGPGSLTGFYAALCRALHNAALE